MYPKAQDTEVIRWDRAEDILPRLRYEGPCKKGIEIANYYGFDLIEPIRTRRSDRLLMGKALPQERVGLLRTYLEQGLDTCTQPVQLCYTYKVPYKQETHFKLDIIGTEKSIAEALVIHAAIAILREYGYKNLYVSLNSIGDADSRDAYIKEVTSFYKKHLDELDTCCIEAFKEDALLPLRCNNKTCYALRPHAPQSIGFLSEQARVHFGDILEYFETLSIPYRIEHHLTGSRHFTSRTVFEIRTEREAGDTLGEDELIAHGDRYDHLSKKAGLGRHIPSIGATLVMKASQAREHFRPSKTAKSKSPKVYLVHLGAAAKRGSLKILEDLREAGIELETALIEDSITRQLAHAEILSVPVIVIIGHKEVLDGTAIVRMRDTRSQEVVPQAVLAKFLQKF